MSRTADIARRVAPGAARWLPAIVITIVGLFVLWPIPAGSMPLSADHTVHLTRIWLFADTLADGSLRGWSSVWFFGTPVGELYPVLGDLLVILARVGSLGILDWPQAYAVGFTIVFLAQGWVLLRAGRAMGLGPWPGLVAALLALLDVGAYREGGWIYTVYYGVWPQTLATSLTWLGLAELATATGTEDKTERRKKIAWGGLSMGGALLAHPMSMLVLAIAGPITVLTVGIGSTARLRRATVTGLLTGVLGLAVAAWWLVPMLGHRGWMASYGWLWRPLDKMIELAFEGQWCQSMPPAVGWVTIAGFVFVAVVGSRPARAFAATAMVLWVMASIDAAWELRLDLVSEGFTHLQYQRFITAAKPGLFLVAGGAVGTLASLAKKAYAMKQGRALAAAPGLVAAALAVWLGLGQRDEWTKNPLPEVQLKRVPNLDGLDADHAALTAWLTERWAERDRFWRVTVRDQRNIHWFMDIPALAEGVPVLKQGFTPGDNFVHKPEKAPTQVQALAQVRYEIRRGQRAGTGAVESFGQVHVHMREGWEADSVATLAGPGSLEVLEDDVDRGTVRVRVSGTDGTSMLVFGIAGFPRWDLEGPDGPVEWFETPVIGDGPVATQAERRSGMLRGGKAHGDDGTEPTLIAVAASDGDYALTYQRWRVADVFAFLLSVVAVLACGLMLWKPRTFARPDEVLALVQRRAGAIGHPIVWGALGLGLLLFGLVRVSQGRSAESAQAFGWALDGRSELSSARAGFHKSNMLIRPAIVFDRKHRDPATATFSGVALGESLQGWIALDDDDAKQKSQGRNKVRIEVRAAGSEWTQLYQRSLRHRPDRVMLRLPTGELAGSIADVRVTLTSEGRRPAEVGFDLELGDPQG